MKYSGSVLCSAFLSVVLSSPAAALDEDVQVFDRDPILLEVLNLSDKFNVLTVRCGYPDENGMPRPHTMTRAYYSPAFSYVSPYNVPFFDNFADVSGDLFKGLTESYASADRIARDVTFRASFEGFLSFAANPGNWYAVEARDKPYDYAIGTDGKMVSLNTPEQYDAMLKKFRAGGWNAEGYPRDRVDEFKDMVRAQCGFGL